MEIALPQPDIYGPPGAHDVLRRRARARSARCRASDRSARSATCRSAARTPAAASRSKAARRRRRTEGVERQLPPDVSRVLQALGIPIVRGRDFTAATRSARPAPSSSTRKRRARYCDGQDPVGQRMKLGRPDSANALDDHRRRRRATCGTSASTARSRREMFRPYSQAVWPSMTITVKTAVEPLHAGAGRARRRCRGSIPISRCRASGRWTM